MRAYAVGDVHGCLDQLKRLLAMIDEDMAARPPRQTFVIFLGDLIDRGPDSAGVVELLMRYAPHGARSIFIQGNHEEFMLRTLAGEPDVMDQWLRFGGSECVTSYGVDVEQLVSLEEPGAVKLLRQQIPASHVAFLSDFADSFQFGDYVFAHAGILPGVALEEQQPRDLRWIREPFLSCRSDHGFVVVHGHTISEKVEERANRIGIDTGAYGGGPLTALVIEDETRRYLQAPA